MHVAIVGAGRVGVASALLLLKHTPAKVSIIDLDAKALESSRVAVQAFGVNAVDEFQAARRSEFYLADDASLEDTLAKLNPKVVICATPFHVNIKIAGFCNAHGWAYLDFTEDVSVTKAVNDMNPTNSTFVLQTGLAPGLVNSVGLHLCDQLVAEGAKPGCVKMRVGALPQVGELPEAYALTWSSAGLINEYYQPVERIVEWKVVQDQPLDDIEELIVNGIKLEAFNTSGGLGSPSMYLRRDLMQADYKTLRYPGHLDFLQKRLMPLLADLEGLDRIKEGVKFAERFFPFTRQDVVHMVVRAQGITPSGRVLERSYVNSWKSDWVFTALEMTTAGTAVAVVELILNDQLPFGVVFGGEVPLGAMTQTKCGKSFMTM